jgi:antirestriction protein ArdC
MKPAVTPPQDDLYASVTARIVAALERGAPPWVRPWSQDVDTMPMNAASRRPYTGVNALLLALEATSQGYPLNRWLTYRQASELGGQVRRGERGTTVVLWRLRKLSATANAYRDEGEPDMHERVIPLLQRRCLKMTRACRNASFRSGASQDSFIFRIAIQALSARSVTKVVASVIQQKEQ